MYFFNSFFESKTGKELRSKHKKQQFLGTWGLNNVRVCLDIIKKKKIGEGQSTFPQEKPKGKRRDGENCGNPPELIGIRHPQEFLGMRGESSTAYVYAFVWILFFEK